MRPAGRAPRRRMASRRSRSAGSRCGQHGQPVPAQGGGEDARGPDARAPGHERAAGGPAGGRPRAWAETRPWPAGAHEAALPPEEPCPEENPPERGAVTPLLPAALAAARWPRRLAARRRRTAGAWETPLSTLRPVTALPAPVPPARPLTAERTPLTRCAGGRAVSETVPPSTRGTAPPAVPPPPGPGAARPSAAGRSRPGARRPQQVADGERRPEAVGRGGRRRRRPASVDPGRELLDQADVLPFRQVQHGVLAGDDLQGEGAHRGPGAGG